MKRILISLVATALTAPAGWAAEGEVSLFAGDLGNAIWTLVIFVLVIVVLGKFAWGPLLGGLQRREEFIRDSLRQAQEDREAAEARLQEVEERLAGAGAEAAQIVDQGRRDAEEVRTRIEQQAQERSDKMVDRARHEIELAKQAAIKELYTTSADLATEIASRILRRELSAEDHERLIRDSIQELGGLKEN